MKKQRQQDKQMSAVPMIQLISIALLLISLVAGMYWMGIQTTNTLEQEKQSEKIQYAAPKIDLAFHPENAPLREKPIIFEETQTKGEQKPVTFTKIRSGYDDNKEVSDFTILIILFAGGAVIIFGMACVYYTNEKKIHNE